MARVLLNPEDMPTVDELLDAISRLRKDYKLLKRIRGSNDKEDPKSLNVVASFLEMLIKREKRNLPKKSNISNGMDIAIDMVASHLLDMDGWELNQTIEETKFKKVMEKLNGPIGNN